ncbi:putative membrane protein [Arcticibacter pallidicorallinus]|uniref:Putative membrane protein n=1 Tax=Arcticibacter pallidicorallinus TaxID=1259464 RepID=A0A2T0U9B3_9SPHI|nr:DUF2157 domain-containing protein [Arcticibacter pallidicorallinus]PRY54516.1 putative membrane protein [Arcticibacter pallidicorallinus]
MNNNELKRLLQANIITEDTAERIREYYRDNKRQSRFTLSAVFAIFASVFVSMGIILIIAHNWDELPKLLKIVFAFVPLLTAQSLCLYTLIRNRDSIAWKEGSATFLFFSLGACMALISQIYHIPGDLAEFVFTWMIFCLPAIYIMNSSVLSILYLAGITWYAAETGYWSSTSGSALWYWLLLILAIPHYYLLLHKHPESNFTIYHNWVVPLSVTAVLGTLSASFPELMYVAYMSLFGVFYLGGQSSFFSSSKRRNNGYLILGALGTVSLLLSLSFEWFWKKLPAKDFDLSSLLISQEFLFALVLSCVALLFLYQSNRLKIQRIKPLDGIFLVFIVVFMIGAYSMISMILINIILLLIGMMTIWEGVRSDHLGILNYGVLIIAALTLCRFFDTDLSFVIRGMLFIVVGAAIFILNTWMLKKRI